LFTSPTYSLIPISSIHSLAFCFISSFYIMRVALNLSGKLISVKIVCDRKSGTYCNSGKAKNLAKKQRPSSHGRSFTHSYREDIDGLIALLLCTKEVLSSIGRVEVNYADKEFCILLLTFFQENAPFPCKMGTEYLSWG
jgi:hypothetical protein